MEEKIKTIKIIHLAICMGTIVAYLFSGQMSIDNLKIPSIDSSSVLYILVPIIAFGLSNFLFKSQLKQIDSKQKIEDNLPVYRNASIIRWAILEGAAFFILFSNPDFVILGILIIIYLIYLRPTEERIKTELNYID